MKRLFMPMMNHCSSKRRKTSSYDHGTFNGPEDLILEILFRLPPKHVLRFKCVSKGWYSIISNPEFLRNHSLRFHRHFRQPTHEFLLLPQDGEKNDLLLNLLDQPLALSTLPITGILPVVNGSDFVLIDSCNGILLYADAHMKKRSRGLRCNSRDFSIHDYYDDPYYICNPVTKTYVKLPNLIALLFEEHENKTAMIKNIDTRILFDPSVSLSYKVVRFLLHNVHGGRQISGTEIQLYIYSSESGSWRLSTSVVFPFCLTKMGVFLNGVFLNGVMYWMTDGTDLFCFDGEKNSVWFQPLPLKPKPDFERRTFYFGESGGRLSLIEKYSDSYRGLGSLTLHDGFDIMEMTVEDSRWTKKYHVNLESSHHLIEADIMVLHVYKTGNKFEEKEEEEEEAVLMKIDGRIVSFSLKSNTFGKELTIPDSDRPFTYVDVHPNSITLFPL